MNVITKIKKIRGHFLLSFIQSILLHVYVYNKLVIAPLKLYNNIAL